MENKSKQSIDPKQIFFSVAELIPILKEWALTLTDLPDLPPKFKHKKPTNFPEVVSTLRDGSQGTIEDLMKELGIIIPTRLPGNAEAPKPAVSIKELPLFVNIFLNRPRWIPKFLWDKEMFQKMFRYIVRNNTTITVINKDTFEEKIAHDSKKL